LSKTPDISEKQARLEAIARHIAEDDVCPKLVVFLGRHAMNVFLPELRISQVHGQPKRKNGQVYLPLFHPAAALYNGGMRQTLTEDFAVIPQILAIIEQERITKGLS
jgi:uracil-DNA glycosylase family 4